MGVHLHLQNLSMLATNLDVRRFFIHYYIPTGGVQILGGPAGDAFITFSKDSDLLSAIMLSGQSLLGQPVTLEIVSGKDMEELFDKRKTAFMTSQESVKSAPPSQSEASQITPDEDVTPYVNPYVDSGTVSDQSYEGDWEQTKDNEGMHNTSEATDHGDSYMKFREPDPTHRAGRESGQVEKERSRDEWANGQYNTSVGQTQTADWKVKRRQEESVDSFPGFIRLDHLPGFIGHPQLISFFDYHKMSIAMPDGIIYGQDNGVNSAFIKLSHHRDALRAASLGQLEIEGCRLDVRMISEGYFYRAYHCEVSRSQAGYKNYDMVPENRFEGSNVAMMPKAPYRGENQAFMQAGYIWIRNLPESVWYKEVKAFLRTYNIGFGYIHKNTITMKRDPKHQMCIALIKCVDYQVALKIKALDKSVLKRNVLKIELISDDTYEKEKNRWDTEQQNLGKKGSLKIPQPVQGVLGTQCGYIRVRNLPEVTSKRALQTFFQQYKITVPRNLMIMAKDQGCQTMTSLLKVTNDQIAVNAASLRNCKLQGRLIIIEKISFKKYFEEKMKLLEQTDSGIQKKESPAQNVNLVVSYVMISNLSQNAKYKELKDFFLEYGLVIAKKGIIMMFGEQCHTAYVKFNCLPEALKIDMFDFSKLQGNDVKMEIITPDVFEHQRLTILERKGQAGAKNKNQETRKEVQPSHFSDLNSANSPGDNFECFIKFDVLANDTTACEIWDWFGGAHGFSKGVYLVRRVDNDHAIFGYVAFDKAQHRNAALAENEPCKAVSAHEAYCHLAVFGPSYRIFQATNLGKDQEMPEDQRAALKQKIRADLVETNQNMSSIFSDMDERLNAEPGNHKFLNFMLVSKLPANATASQLWKQYGGPGRNCKSVLVVRKRKKNGLQTLFAFIAFGNLKGATKLIKWNIRETYTKLAAVKFDCSIFECTKPGQDREVPKDERILLRRQLFNTKKRETPKAKKFENTNNLAEKMKEETSTDEDDQQSMFSRLILGAQLSHCKQLSFIFFVSNAIPADATASGMSKWLGGPNKTSKGGIMVRTATGAAECVFIAFENRADSIAALQMSEGGRMRSPASTRRAIVTYSSEYEIFESTETGEDSKVSEEQLHKLQQLTPLLVEDTHAQGTKRKVQDLENTEAKKIKVYSGVQE